MSAGDNIDDILKMAMDFDMDDLDDIDDQPQGIDISEIIGDNNEKEDLADDLELLKDYQPLEEDAEQPKRKVSAQNFRDDMAMIGNFLKNPEVDEMKGFDNLLARQRKDSQKQKDDNLVKELTAGSHDAHLDDILSTFGGSGQVGFGNDDGTDGSKSTEDGGKESQNLEVNLDKDYNIEFKKKETHSVHMTTTPKKVKDEKFTHQMSSYFKPIPVVDNEDEVVQKMKERFGIHKKDIDKAVEERFGKNDLHHQKTAKTVKKSKSLNTNNQAATSHTKATPKPAPKEPEKDVLSILDLYDSQAVKEVKSLNDEVSENSENYFSSLQEGEWTAAHDDISPVDVQPSKSIEAMLDGKHTSKVTTFAYTSKIFLCGTKTGEILECDLQANKVRQLKLDSMIISCDISEDQSTWAVGSQQSEVFFKKSLGGWARKKLGNFNNRPIVQLKFINKNELIIATDQDITKVTLSDIRIGFEVRFTKIISKKKSIVQVMTMPLEGDKTLLITGELSKLMFTPISPVPDKTQILRKPAYIEDGWAPIISWVIQKDKNLPNVLIFWKSFLFLIKKDQSGRFVICAQKSLQCNIIWGTVLGNRVVCFLDENFEMTLQSVEYIFATFASGGGFGGVHQLPKERNKDARVITVRKDGGLTLSMVNSIRSIDESVGFMTDKGLVKANLLTIKQLSEKYIDRGKWLPALRLAVEVYKGKIIASQEEIDEIQQTLPIFTKKYIKNFIKSEKDNATLMSSIVSVSVEAMFETGNLEHIFSMIRQNVDNLIFWREIEKFVMNGRIKVIPNRYLLDGSTFLTNKAFSILLLELPIEAVEEDDDCLPQIIQTVKKRKLWAPFFRMALNMSDKLLKVLLGNLLVELISLSDQTIELQKAMIGPRMINKFLEKTDLTAENNASSMFKIYWFVWKILNWRSMELLVDPEDTAELKIKIWTNCLSWLLEDQNSTIMASKFPQLYFEMIYDLFMNHEIMLGGSQALKSRIAEVYSGYIENLRFQKKSSMKKSLTSSFGATMEAQTTDDSENAEKSKNSSEIGSEDSTGVKDSEGKEADKGGSEDQKQDPSAGIDSSLTKFTKKKMTVQEELDLPPWFIDNTSEALEKAELDRLILLILETKLEDHRLQKGLAWLWIRVLNMSMFSHLFKHKKWIFKHLKLFIEDPFEKKANWMYYKPASKGDTEEHLVRVLSTAKYSKQVLEPLGPISRSSLYNRIYAFVEDVCEGAVQSLNTHMNNPSNQTGSEDVYIFRWLTNKFDYLTKRNRRVLGELRTEVIKFLPKLIEIDKMQARDVITRFIDVENSSEVVGLLQEFPDIQINYIEALLETELLDRDQRVPINLKNRYLELKCQMDPDQIVKALNRFKLPLDDSLKICKKYNQRHAIAHITYRLGLTKEAMDSYLEIIETSFEAYLSRSDIELKEVTRLISEAQFSFKMVLEICMDLAKHEEIETKQFFENFLKFIIGQYLSLRGKLERAGGKDLSSLVKITELSEYIKDSFIETLLIYYAQVAGTKEIVKIIQKNEQMRSLQLKDYAGLMRFLGFERKIMDDIELLCGNGHSTLKIDYVKNSTKGTIKSNLCSITQERIKRDCMLLPCAHPVDLIMAKTQAVYPKDFRCPRCDEETFVERRLMSRIYNLQQTDLKKLALEAIEEETYRIKGNKSIGKSLGFLHSEHYDEMLNNEFCDLYEQITLDKFMPAC